MSNDKIIHDDMGLDEFVIPGLTEPALACPVLDTGYSIRGNPVPLFGHARGFQSGIQSLFVLVPRFHGDGAWIPAGVYPVLDTGRE
jgi:hypothetical protein